ncbi:GAF and ANTAR domain-containing protein [Aquihabitans sp. G128]|uniref:GAF and ANTAR domain-containing protein n=1 Tax=Aquihabitans sp. G128 TaxID=2849779 RepID=UPI001C23DB9F|nr:GAF and ANTAR domain-containing protein [Aquihabitans sp. G128]QXC60854.1 GAF and ANTAR domain-containing protein [Aquihabitans sp. G128]
MAHDELIGPTFVELADTLVEGYDLIEFLLLLSERAVEVLGVAAAGVLLADQRGALRVVASSTEEMRLLELVELQSSEGPCFECWTQRGGSVRADDLTLALERWPVFAPAAIASGFASAYALPLRLRDDRLGALNLFAATPDGLSLDDQAVGQAMADIATIGILHERTVSQHVALAGQLQAALDSRVVLEQSKGMVAEQTGTDAEAAFALIRAHARRSNQRLGEVARAIAERRISADDLRSSPHAEPPPG